MQWYHWLLIVIGFVFVAVVFLVNRRAAAKAKDGEEHKDIYPMW